MGIDYPIGYVRWTENRNLAEFLRLMSEKKVDVRSLISHRFSINDAESVYKNIMENEGGPYIGVVLEYPTVMRRKGLRRSIYYPFKTDLNKRPYLLIWPWGSSGPVYSARHCFCRH